MLIINAATESTRGTAATPAWLWTVASDPKYKMEFPQVVDEKKDLYKYSPTYPSVGLPFHIGIDLRTMKVYEAVRGSMTLASMESKAKTALSK